MWTTHEVINQPASRGDHNPWHDCALLQEHAQLLGASDPNFLRAAEALGAYTGSVAARSLATSANRVVPILQTHDRSGQRRDEVEFHPAYHSLMRAACAAGLKDWCWTEPRASAPIERALLLGLWNGLEQGTACPITMSSASVAMLAIEPGLRAHWLPKVCARDYQAELARPVLKRALTIGMALTEKQGGSDLRAVSTRAIHDSGDGTWPTRLIGHKWFCSAPMSDGFLSLARETDGVSCFFVPRVLDDGTHNALRLMRLKDKCGNRSNASAEVEFEGAAARRVGAPGRGIATLIGMAHLTRFDIVCAVPGMMRAALDHAWYHTTHRHAFGATLSDHGLMRNLLADLALEWEAANLLALALAGAFGRGGVYASLAAGTAAPGETAAVREAQVLARVLTPIAKYWLCKRLPSYVAECMECLGGNGYVEDWPLAALYREAPLNGIWEGSANVICLDVLRSLQRDPQGLVVLRALVQQGEDARLETRWMSVERGLASASVESQVEARALVERAAGLIAATLMRLCAPGEIAETYALSRIEDSGIRAYGTLPARAPLAAIVERAFA
jgi:putative acyl-CoA dehydrogenase